MTTAPYSQPMIPEMRLEGPRTTSMAKLILPQLERHVVVTAVTRANLTGVHGREVIAAVENWWDKYRVTLRDIELQRDAAVSQLEAYLRDLEYVG
jgi:hypothetical protein